MNKIVTLGDDKTALLIKGYVMMNYLLNSKRICRFGYFVPELGITLLSIKQHIKYRGCYFHTENDQVILAYPKAVLFTKVDPEFTLSIKPPKHLTLPYAFDEEKAIFSTASDMHTFNVLCQEKAKYITNNNAKHKLALTVRVTKAIEHRSIPTQELVDDSTLIIHASHCWKCKQK